MVRGESGRQGKGSNVTHGGSGRPDAIEHVGSEGNRDKEVFGIALDLGKGKLAANLREA